MSTTENKTQRQRRRIEKGLWKEDEMGTHNIAECNDVEESGGPSGRGSVGFVDVFVREKRRSLAHRIGQLRQLLDRRHRSLKRHKNLWNRNRTRHGCIYVYRDRSRSKPKQGRAWGCCDLRRGFNQIFEFLYLECKEFGVCSNAEVSIEDWFWKFKKARTLSLSL